MERRSKEKDSEDSRSHTSVIDSIQKLAAHNARADLDTDEKLLLFLQSWWSRTYSRPLKDPVLMSYSIEELLYEFYDRIERSKAEQERLEQDDVKIEESRDKAAEDWAEKMEREEREAAMREEAHQVEQLTKDPTKDPVNVTWMEEQIQKGKEEFGESFGENIKEGFNE